MTKSEMMDRIASFNRNATREFLAEFSERDLSDYLQQLRSQDPHAQRRDKLDAIEPHPPATRPTPATLAM